MTVTNARGSINPGTNSQYRGKAPGARIFSIGEPMPPDSYLQERAAQTNAFISNNSWNYGGDTTYSIGAASFDAATRDALPRVTGSQPLLFVFGAGNAGGGDDSGQGGNSESILSPATAKNVITVGAIEQPRDITNQVIINCISTNINGTNVLICTTNEPWRGMTSSASEVAAFSSRGNVGIGVEGEFGRYKPDLMAPGTFVISTRSLEWDERAYYNPTSHIVDVLRRHDSDEPGVYQSDLGSKQRGGLHDQAGAQPNLTFPLSKSADFRSPGRAARSRRSLRHKSLFGAG